jgi:hypothetical protein
MDERDEKVDNTEDKKCRQNLVAGNLVRKADEDDRIEHADAAGNVADDAGRQGHGEDR